MKDNREGRILRRPLREVVYGRLLDLIVSGQLAPLEAIREDEVAEWLSVSRHPVREAIAQLEANGFVDTRLGASPRVSRNEPRDAALRERLILSLLAIALECSRAEIGTATIEELLAQRRAFGSAVASADSVAMINALIAFDDCVILSAEAPPLIEAFRDRLAPHLLRPVDHDGSGEPAHQTWRGADYMDAVITAFETRSRAAAIAAIEAARAPLVEAMHGAPATGVPAASIARGE